MAFLLLLPLFDAWLGWDHPASPWWRQDVAHWVDPDQSLATISLIAFYWRSYQFNWSWKWSGIGILLGSIGIFFWLLPTICYDQLGLTGKTSGVLSWLGVDARAEGFDPSIFEGSAAWWSVVFMRFLRAAVVVALVEEIFWRGFMMRFVHDRDGDFWKQPFGRASWKSYLVVTGLFMAAHAPIDYAGAFVYGSLTWLLCVWSKNLGACVVMHAIANLLMGLYIMQTGKYGLW
ncbi:MAG: CAAX prenyl protease-related protein [Luteolibacter sp.]